MKASVFVVLLALFACVSLTSTLPDSVLSSELSGLLSDLKETHSEKAAVGQDEGEEGAALAVASRSLAEARAHAQAAERAEAHARLQAMVATQARQVLVDIARIRSDLARQRQSARAASSEETADLAVGSQVSARARVQSLGRKVLADIARVRGDLARERGHSEQQAALAVTSQVGASARAEVASKAERVLEDIRRMKQDLDAPSSGDVLVEVRRDGIGTKVQVTVDAVHCRNLNQIAAIDGEDSEEYKAYLAQVYAAQKQMQPNFRLINMLENLYNFGKDKNAAARLTRDGEERVNPCKRYAEGAASSGAVNAEVEANFGVSPMTGLPYSSARERDLSIDIWTGRYERGDAAEKELYGAYLCSLQRCPAGFKPDNAGIVRRFEDSLKAGFKKMVTK